MCNVINVHIAVENIHVVKYCWLTNYTAVKLPNAGNLALWQKLKWVGLHLCCTVLIRKTERWGYLQQVYLYDNNNHLYLLHNVI